MTAPIEAKHREKMNEIAAILDSIFAPAAFMLLIADRDGNGRANYISNANREDMLCLLKEFIANQEARTPPSTVTPQ